MAATSTSASLRAPLASRAVGTSTPPSAGWVGYCRGSHGASSAGSWQRRRRGGRIRPMWPFTAKQTKPTRRINPTVAKRSIFETGRLTHGVRGPDGKPYAGDVGASLPGYLASLQPADQGIRQSLNSLRRARPGGVGAWRTPSRSRDDVQAGSRRQRTDAPIPALERRRADGARNRVAQVGHGLRRDRPEVVAGRCATRR